MRHEIMSAVNCGVLLLMCHYFNHKSDNSFHPVTVCPLVRKLLFSWQEKGSCRPHVHEGICPVCLLKLLMLSLQHREQPQISHFLCELLPDWLTMNKQTEFWRLV